MTRPLWNGSRNSWGSGSIPRTCAHVHLVSVLFTNPRHLDTDCFPNHVGVFLATILCCSQTDQGLVGLDQVLLRPPQWTTMDAGARAAGCLPFWSRSLAWFWTPNRCALWGWLGARPEWSTTHQHSEHDLGLVVTYDLPRSVPQACRPNEQGTAYPVLVSDHSIPNLERLAESDSEEELGQLCGMAGKYHRNKRLLTNWRTTQTRSRDFPNFLFTNKFLLAKQQYIGLSILRIPKSIRSQAKRSQTRGTLDNAVR